jgi:ABC-type multidrug transport system ATPase subunit
VPNAVLEASEARIDKGGMPVLEQLTLKTTGSNVVVLGAPRALFEVCTGTLALTAGALCVEGVNPREAVASGAVASAPMDVPVPPRWTLEKLASESARLAGHGGREMRERARSALHVLGLDAMARTKLGGAELAVRRGAMIAAALATGAGTLLVEDFTAGLSDAAARSLGRMFVAACKDRRWMLFAGKLVLGSPIGLHADEAIVFSGGRVAMSGHPAEIAARERTFSVRTAEEPEALAAALRERGAFVDTRDHALTITLPEGLSTLDVVRMAVDKSVVVLELLPVSDALV